MFILARGLSAWDWSLWLYAASQQEHMVEKTVHRAARKCRGEGGKKRPKGMDSVLVCSSIAAVNFLHLPQ